MTSIDPRDNLFTRPGPLPLLSSITEVKNKEDGSIDPKTFTIVDTSVPTGQTALLLGSSYSGKTTLLVHGLNNIIKEKSYDAIIIFTESPNAKPLEGLNPSNRITLSQGFYPNIVRLLVRINRASDNRFRFFTVLDDITDMKNNSTYKKMVLTMRNSNISTAVLIQDPTLCPPSHRGSFHNIYFLGAGSNIQRKDYIVKHWLNGHIRHRLGVPGGSTKRGLMSLLNEWFDENTKRGNKEGDDASDRGKFLWFQTITDELSVQNRPPPI